MKKMEYIAICTVRKPWQAFRVAKSFNLEAFNESSLGFEAFCKENEIAFAPCEMPIDELSIVENPNCFTVED